MKTEEDNNKIKGPQLTIETAPEPESASPAEPQKTDEDTPDEAKEQIKGNSKPKKKEEATAPAEEIVEEPSSLGKPSRKRLPKTRLRNRRTSRSAKYWAVTFSPRTPTGARYGSYCSSRHSSSSISRIVTVASRTSYKSTNSKKNCKTRNTKHWPAAAN